MSQEEWRLSPERYSNWTKLVRIRAWVIRFVENCKMKKEDRVSGPLNVVEIEESKTEMIKETQRRYFAEEYD